MKTKQVIIILTVALVVLLGGYFALRAADLGGGENAAPTADSISLADVGEVTSFSYTYSGVTSSFEQAESGDWVCMEDDTLKLDQTVLKNMAEQAKSITATQLVTDDPERLEEFGLSEPQCRLTVTGQQGTYTLLIGSHLEFNDTYYVQLEGQDAVYSVSYALAEAFCKAREDLAEEEPVE